MDWIVPLTLILTGILCLAIDNLLRRYISNLHEPRSFQKKRYYSMQALSERFSRRMPLSWAMIAFGLFWSLTNLI